MKKLTKDNEIKNKKNNANINNQFLNSNNEKEKLKTTNKF